MPVSVQLGNQSLIEVLSVKNRYQNSEKTEQDALNASYVRQQVESCVDVSLDGYLVLAHLKVNFEHHNIIVVHKAQYPRRSFPELKQMLTFEHSK